MKNDKWYYEDHGRAQGPVTSLELVQMVKKGALSQVDLVFKEGSQQWFPVENYTELTELLGQIVTEPESKWVALRVTEVDGQEKFEQIGPYSTEQVLQFLDKGQLKFSDFIWKPSFTSWVTLGAVDELAKPLASSVQVDMSLYQMPKHDIIEDNQVTPIKAYKPEIKYVVDEPIPAEANSKDLAEPEWLNGIVKPQVRASEPEVYEEVSQPTSDSDGHHDEQIDRNVENIDKQVRIEKATDEITKANSWIRGFLRRADEQAQEYGHVTMQKAKGHFKNIRTEKLRQIATRGASYILAIVVFYAGFLLLKNIFVEKFSSFNEESVVQQQVPAPSPARQVANTPKKVIRPQVAVEKSAEPKPAQEPKKQLEVKPEIKAPKRTIATKKSVRIVKPRKALNFKKMKFKERSFYHHRDQKLIFYTSQKAMSLANDLGEAAVKFRSNKSGWNRYYKGWKAKLNKATPADLRDNEVNGNYLYPKLIAKLGQALLLLELRGEDYNAQISGSRSPTKNSSINDVVSELKELQYKARKL